MTALLVLLGAALILSQTDKKKSTGRPDPSGPIPIGPGAENFESYGDFLAYKRSVASRLIRELLYRIAVPTEQPNVFLVMPGTNGAVGPNEWGAYYGFEAVHDQGYVIWVPTTFHYPEAAHSGAFAVFLPPNVPPPDPNYAILILPDEPWPALGAQAA